MKTYTCLFLLCYCLIFKVSAQEWKVFSVLNSDLPYQKIHKIGIDNLGRGWLGTGATYNDGILAVFDGKSWTVFDAFNSNIPDFYAVTGFAFDSSNGVWFGTDGLFETGLVHYDGFSFTVYDTTNTPMKANGICSVVIDKQQNKWVSNCDDGLFKFDGVNWTVYDTSNSPLPSNTVYSLMVDEDTIWASVYGLPPRLMKFDHSNWVNHGVPSGTPPFNLRPDGLGNIWMCNRINVPYISRLSGTNWIFYDPTNSPLTGARARCLAIDSLGIKWVGTEAGLFAFNGNVWVHFDVSNSPLPSNIINSIEVDQNNNKWIGTNEGLVIYRYGGIVLPSTEPISAGRELTIFPNPTHGEVTIQLAHPHSAMTMKICDVSGIELASFQIPRSGSSVDLTGLPQGLYFYSILDREGARFSGKIELR